MTETENSHYDLTRKSKTKLEEVEKVRIANFFTLQKKSWWMTEPRIAHYDLTRKKSLASPEMLPNCSTGSCEIKTRSGKIEKFNKSVLSFIVWISKLSKQPILNYPGYTAHFRYRTVLSSRMLFFLINWHWATQSISKEFLLESQRHFLKALHKIWRKSLSSVAI